MRQSCPFHTSDDVPGVRNPDDGSYRFECDEPGHPAPGPYRWLQVPEPPGMSGLGGLAEELDMPTRLVDALRSLGEGWFEYGLVERAYALAHPDDFRQLVERWGHTANAPKEYTASTYIGSLLGRMTRAADVFYRADRGTGRWSYNRNSSYWSLDPQAPWEDRTTWVSVIDDDAQADRVADLACRAYVPGAKD